MFFAAAEGGLAAAQCRAGQLALWANSKAKGLEWFRKSAVQGNVEAQFERRS